MLDDTSMGERVKGHDACQDHTPTTNSAEPKMWGKLSVNGILRGHHAQFPDLSFHTSVGLDFAVDTSKTLSDNVHDPFQREEASCYYRKKQRNAPRKHSLVTMAESFSFRENLGKKARNSRSHCIHDIPCDIYSVT